MTSENALHGQAITVGVGGGIAAYKAAFLVSQLKQHGAEVQVILTRAGSKFVTSLTFEALSHRPVLQNLFADAPLDHVRLAHESDLFVVAPATFDLIGKLANGLADDYLTTTLAATRRPVLLCPAMETQMYENPVFQTNLNKLKKLGYHVMPPDSGPLASGRSGAGRLPEPQQILGRVIELLASAKRLAGKRVLVSAGPTRERIDPMRVLSNRSSGKMGYALAQAAREMGAEVTLVSGPVSLSAPPSVEMVHVESAQEMFDAMTARAPEADIILMAAAVADWRPAEPSEHKQSKKGKTSIELAPNPDILKHLGEHKQLHQILVGFAAETQDFIERGQKKLEEKHADYFVVNNVAQAAESHLNEVVLLSKDDDPQSFPMQDKLSLARGLLLALDN